MIARGNLTRAIDVYIQLVGVDRTRPRLLFVVSKQDKTELFARPTGLRLTERGLFFPAQGAGEAYMRALRDSNAGMYEFSLDGVEQLKPLEPQG